MTTSVSKLLSAELEYQAPRMWERNSPGAGLRLTPSICCICNVDDTDPVGVGEDFEYRTSADTYLAVRCRRCGLIFLNPRPADEEFSRIYPDHYHAFDFHPEEFGLVYRVRRRLEARRVLGWCRGLPANARILDVGCGDGFHLRLLRDFGGRGWRLEGVDADSRAVAAAKNAGLQVHRGHVEQLDLPPGSYDLVLLIMTVEHLTDPATVLRAVRRLLVPGGRVVIVTDNAGSPDFRIFGGRHWGGYHFPRHTYLFTQRTLTRLAEVTGLSVDRMATPFSPVNWVYSIRNWLDDWGVSARIVDWFSLKSAVALVAFTLLDMPLAVAGRGGNLRATLIRPAADKAAA